MHGAPLTPACRRLRSAMSTLQLEGHSVRGGQMMGAKHIVITVVSRVQTCRWWGITEPRNTNPARHCELVRPRESATDGFTLQIRSSPLVEVPPVPSAKWRGGTREARSSSALLAHQGLRATTSGGHIVIVKAMNAQFPGGASQPAVVVGATI